MNGDSLLPGLQAPQESVAFVPTREAGLARLDQFVSRAGRTYASRRNYDLGPEQRDNVSVLSPWIRHRLITEDEVLRATLARHTASASEKFVQEVFWRTYFKGWLEQRPSVWSAYQQAVQSALPGLDRDAALARDYATATEGRTAIDAFDAWANELVQTGYLHNHARMWFASIWIFTLRLPWELGADFFLRHLADGDPASNTLSWRWVAGLHTKGKTYLARASNIATYTDGRFRPEGQLATQAPPLTENADHPKRPLPASDHMPQGDFLLLVTEEDCHPQSLVPDAPSGVLGLLATEDRSPHPTGDVARAFAHGAVADALDRLGASNDPKDGDWASLMISAAQEAGATQVVTAYAPAGPVANRLAAACPALKEAGISLHQIRRPHDTLTWPYASRGFFPLKKKIPGLLREMGYAV